MKKMFCLLFILLPILAGAQTRPDWLDIKNKPYNDVRDSGVKGDGVTDDWPALKNAIERGGLVVIPAVATGASASTYFADGLWWALPTNPGECHYARVAGGRGFGALCGPFCVVVDAPLSLAVSNLGARLSFLKP